MRITNRVMCFLALISSPPVSGATDWVPFVIPAHTAPGSVLTYRDIHPIEPKGPRLETASTTVDCVPAPGHPQGENRSPSSAPETGYFTYQNKRVRLWGVNLSFGANFPTHSDAPHVARRLASAGVNTVRLHHMDTAAWPRGIWDPQRPGVLFPEALDRLDYFVHALAQQGIWINLNLHVGHAHSRVLGLPAATRSYDKVINLFTPDLIAAQKDYARELLNHRNPYRGSIRYAEDPALAIVEITNENSFFMWDGEETLRNLPPYYEALLRGQYNAWLRTRYGDRPALAAAWSQGVDPPGENLLANSSLQQAPSSPAPSGWRLEHHGQTDARISTVTVPDHGSVLRIDRIQTDATGWHLQFNQAGFALEDQRYYTVVMEASSDTPRTVTCSVGQAHDPWHTLGLSRSLDLKPTWQTFRLGFRCTADEDNARVSIAFGDAKIPFHLRRIELRPGGQTGLLEGESPAHRNVKLFQDNESVPRTRDRLVFLAETEKRFFDAMYRFVKRDLNCQALVTGTIVFGPLGLYSQSDMDFVDAHAYWQHPRFPNTSWDVGDWLINQKPMSAYPQEATLFRLAAERLLGKPFTVSEYNHPAPLDSQAETVPLLASFAAAQDWDGLWLYTYSHSGDAWDREHLNSYFDIDTNPAKWGFMRTGSLLFRDGAFGRLGTLACVPIGDTPGTPLLRLTEQHQQHDRDLFRILADTYNTGRSNLLVTQLAATLETQTKIYPLNTHAPSLTWVAEAGRGFYGGEGPGALVLAGHRELVSVATGGQAELSSPAFAVITMAALDGRDLEQSNQLLVTACGRCENTEMVFSEDRSTVGRRWGHAPVRIEPVTGRVALPAGRWMAQSLTPAGLPRGQARVEQGDHAPFLKLASEHKTMWYLITRKN